MVAAQELREAYDFPVVDFEVKGSTKLARSEAVTPLAEGGKVWVSDPAKAPWVRGRCRSWWDSRSCRTTTEWMR